MSFEPATYDLRLYLGEVLRLVFAFTYRVTTTYPPVDAPFPLAGWTVTAVFNLPTPLTLSDGAGLVVDTSADTVALTVTKAQTYLIQKCGSWYMELENADDSGYVIRGSVQVLAP